MLCYGDRPDYARIMELFMIAMKIRHIDQDAPIDWSGSPIKEYTAEPKIMNATARPVDGASLKTEKTQCG